MIRVKQPANSFKIYAMKIKVCGMGANLEAVAAIHPDYLGFIFWKPSARYFSGTVEQDIHLPKIGVFVNTEIQEVVDHVKIYDLDGIQLHGDESPEYCARLQERLAEMTNDLIVIKAFQISPEFHFANLSAYTSHVDYYLFDAKGELPGGNSIGFNWELLNAYSGSTPYFLSGGIGLDDIDQIRAFLKNPVSALCHAIDVNSRFEIRPGFKNIERLEPFLAQIRELENDSK